MLILQNISYIHTNKDVLFSHLNITIQAKEKLALIGNNGIGKSILLKIIARQLLPASGNMVINSKPYYIPQIVGQYNHLTIAQALQVQDKLLALQNITAGDVSEKNFTILNDDWTIEERSIAALEHWGLQGIALDTPLGLLSGGQKTKVFLAGITIHQPVFVLLDEPSNHLDNEARELLYQFIQTYTGTLIVVSHDRQLLNLMSAICELSKKGLTMYGGNYNFYREQKQLETEALLQDVHSSEKAVRKAREKERETIERQQKLDARGKKKQEKAGVPTIMMNTLRNNAEKSTAKSEQVHAQKMEGLQTQLQQLRDELPEVDKMKFGFEDGNLHKGKELFTAKGINYNYGNQTLWQQPLDLDIISGDRIVIKGGNGSGKTTLIKIMLQQLKPTEGSIVQHIEGSVYIDQDYSLINNNLTVYAQAQQFNYTALQEHEIKIRLTRFLFTRDFWDRPCSALSGGEKMRLTLCCLAILNKAPDIIILDEPTNNLDLQNIEILTNAIADYDGTLLVISHDSWFLEQLQLNKEIIM